MTVVVGDGGDLYSWVWVGLDDWHEGLLAEQDPGHPLVSPSIFCLVHNPPS